MGVAPRVMVVTGVGLKTMTEALKDLLMIGECLKVGDGGKGVAEGSIAVGMNSWDRLYRRNEE